VYGKVYYEALDVAGKTVDLREVGWWIGTEFIWLKIWTSGKLL
jgi:hypothetical protein